MALAIPGAPWTEDGMDFAGVIQQVDRLREPEGDEIPLAGYLSQEGKRITSKQGKMAENRMPAHKDPLSTGMYLDSENR
jgi:hypothetical protein